MTRHLITSALPYINGVKHLGNLVGSMLPADIYARYLRLRGEETLFICATDEHGTPAELAAKEAGLPVADYCREQHAVQKEIGERFGLSWDHFGRSSSPQNHELTQHFAARSSTREGYLEERVTKQVYSPVDDRFLPDRYIVGTCPYCGYESARGDQCENCTRVLDPTDLLEPRSAISGSTDLEVRETKHLFLLQSKLADEVTEWVEEPRRRLDRRSRCRSPASGSPRGSRTAASPATSTGACRSWAGPASRTRSGTCGSTRRSSYIGATAEWADAGEGRDWRSWWYDADDVEYTQFMAKDNVPFHTVSFPVTLIGSREPWTRADQIKGFNWLTYYGGKFSTSQGRGVFMDQALDTYPADYWRWFLFANAPESSDSSFTWEQFAVAVNKDLADSFGNLVNRCLTLSAKHYGPVVPAGGEPGEREAQLAADLAEVVAAYTELMARQGAAEVGQRAAARLVAGQRVLGAERAVEGREGRPRRGRGDLPHGDQRACACSRCSRRRSSRRRRPPCSRRSARPTRAGPTPARSATSSARSRAGPPGVGAAGAVRQDRRRRAGRARRRASAAPS